MLDRMLPRILSLTTFDWAGLCYNMSRAVNEAAGCKIWRSFTMYPHPFGIPTGPSLHAAPGVTDSYYADRLLASEFQDAARKSNVLLHGGDGDYGVFRILRLVPKPFKQWRMRAVIHAGSAFRNNPARYNRIDDRHFHLRYVGFDSLHLAAYAGVSNGITKGFYPAIYLPSDFPAVGRDVSVIVIGHHPSNEESKGSSQIKSVIGEIASAYPQVRVSLTGGIVSHAQSLLWKAGCNFYIDQMNATVGGFGVSALEALHLGSIVFGDFRNVPATALPGGMVHCENAYVLHKAIEHFLTNDAALRQAQAERAEWCAAHTPLKLGKQWLADFQAMISSRRKATVFG